MSVPTHWFVCTTPTGGRGYTHWFVYITLIGVVEVNPIRRSVLGFGYTAPTQFFIFHFPLYIPHMDSPSRYRVVVYGLACLAVSPPRNQAWDVVLGEGNWVGKDGIMDGATVLGQLRDMEAQRVRQRLRTMARGTSSSSWEDLLAE